MAPETDFTRGNPTPQPGIPIRMATPINVAIDTPASKIRLFIMVVVILGALVTASFFMILRSRRTDPPPKSPPPTPIVRLITPRSATNL